MSDPWIIEAIHWSWGWTQYAWAPNEGAALKRIQDIARGLPTVCLQRVNARTGEVVMWPKGCKELKQGPRYNQP